MAFRSRASALLSSLALSSCLLLAGAIQARSRPRQASNRLGPVTVPGLKPSTEFSVKVVEPAEAAADLFTFHSQSKAAAPMAAQGNCNGYFAHLEGWTASWVNLEMRQDFNGGFEPVVLEVSRSGSMITDASLTPDGNSEISFKDGKAYIKLLRPTQVNVDVNRQFEFTDTGPDYEGEPMHSFTVFANPPLPFPHPDRQSPDVLVVQPGDQPPAQFNQTTLYFAAGVHELDFHKPYELLEGKHYYLPVDAWVEGPMKTAVGAIKDIRLFGYGTISGDRIPRVREGTSCFPNKSPEGLITDKVENMFIVGLTFVDFPNHHLVLGGSDNAAKPNHLEFVKVFGWRANGDGVHVFMHWQVKDLFLRTQDDSLHIASCTKSVNFQRVKTWNDANGASFIFTAGHGGTNVTLTDSLALYTRAMWAFWAGGRVFSLRGIADGEVVSNIHVSNVKVTDPLPTMPFLDFNAVADKEANAHLQQAAVLQTKVSERKQRNAAEYWTYNEEKLRLRTATQISNVTFSDIHVRNHSTVRVDEHGEPLPHGIVSVISAVPGMLLENLVFNNVVIGGLPMWALVADEEYFSLGDLPLHDVTVDGVSVDELVKRARS